MNTGGRLMRLKLDLKGKWISKLEKVGLGFDMLKNLILTFFLLQQGIVLSDGGALSQVFFKMFHINRLIVVISITQTLRVDIYMCIRDTRESQSRPKFIIATARSSWRIGKKMWARATKPEKKSTNLEIEPELIFSICLWWSRRVFRAEGSDRCRPNTSDIDGVSLSHAAVWKQVAQWSSF